SSRRRHTRFSRDWSSDVCSSDLLVGVWNPGGKTDDLVSGEVWDKWVSNLELARGVSRCEPGLDDVDLALFEWLRQVGHAREIDLVVDSPHASDGREGKDHIAVAVDHGSQLLTVDLL